MTKALDNIRDLIADLTTEETQELLEEVWDTLPESIQSAFWTQKAQEKGWVTLEGE